MDGEDAKTLWVVPAGFDTQIHVATDGVYKNCRGTRPAWITGTGYDEALVKAVKRAFCKRCALRWWIREPSKQGDGEIAEPVASQS